MNDLLQTLVEDMTPEAFHAAVYEAAVEWFKEFPDDTNDPTVETLRIVLQAYVSLFELTHLPDEEVTLQ